MKKLAIITMIFAIAAIAFAEDGAVSLAVSGDATLSWGIDLDTMDTGFNNAFANKLVVTLFAKQTLTHAGENYPYGTISLKDIELSSGDVKDGATGTLANFKIGGVSADVLLSEALMFSVYGAPGVDVGVAKAFKDIEGNETNDVAAAIAGTGTAYGTAITYKAGDISFKAKVGSFGDWTDTDDPDQYFGGADFSLGLGSTGSVAVGVMYGPFTTGGDLMIGLKPSFTFGPLGLNVAADFDVLNGFNFDVALGTTVTLENIAVLNINAYYGNTLKAQVIADLKAVENLTAKVTADLYGILTAFDFGVKAELAYNINGIKPYATLVYHANDTIDLTAGLELGGLVEKTTFTLEWATTDITGAVDSATPLGKVIAKAKVAF